MTKPNDQESENLENAIEPSNEEIARDIRQMTPANRGTDDDASRTISADPEMVIPDPDEE